MHYLPLFTLILTILFQLHESRSFSTNPDIDLYLDKSYYYSKSYQCIAISPQQDKIVVGYYKDYYMTVYTRNGTFLNSLYLSVNSTINAIEWTKDYGIIAISFNKIYQFKNYSDYYPSNTKNFDTDYIRSMTIDDSYLAIQLDSKIQQYSLTTFSRIKSYYPPQLLKFTVIKYSQNHQYLFTGLASDSNVYTMRIYSVSTGNSLSYSIDVGSSVRKLLLKQDGNSVIGLNNNGDLFQFSTDGVYKKLGTNQTNDIFMCPDTYLIAGRDSDGISIYNEQGQWKQKLNASYVINLYCSQNYIASINYSGNLKIFSYAISPIVWLCLCIYYALLFGGVVYVVYSLKKKIKQRTSDKANPLDHKYAKVDDTIISSTRKK